MAASEDKKANKKQVFDVAKPGKTPASASARPIIVTHKPMVDDPMVSKGQPAKADDEKPSGEPVTKNSDVPMSHGEKILEPLHEDTAAEPKEAAAAEEAKDEAVSETPTEQADAPVEKTKEDKPAEQPSDAAASDINAAAEELNEKKVKQEAEAKENKEEIERQEKVSKLIEEKQYYVKVGEAHHKRQSKSVGVILLCLLLVLIAVYLAIDAGLIKTDFELPYDFLDEYFARIS